MTLQQLFAGQDIDWKRTKLIRHNLTNENVAGNYAAGLLDVYQSVQTRTRFQGCDTIISFLGTERTKQFNYEDASMNNYFYLVKVIPYFLARSIDSMERADYLLRMRNPILKDFISDLNKEIKRIETIGLFDSVEPLRPLSQVINNYRPIFLNS